MITLRKTEYWTEETFEILSEKVRHETRQVRFGLFNSFDTKHKAFTTPWIGQLYPAQKKFKLFRVTGREHTSDLSVNGEYTTRLSKPVVVIRHKVHFTALLGLSGLLVSIYVAWHLLRQKGVMDSILFLLAGLLTAGIYYTIITLRDLNKNEAEIKRLIYKVPRRKYEEVEEEEEEEDMGTGVL